MAKAAVIERFNRSLKELMYKQFTIKGNRIWFNILDEISCREIKEKVL